MILSENWLREWVNPDLDSVALADHLTMLGLEVDSLLPVAKGLCGVVVAEILTADPHPNADRLRVCKVNNGNEIVQIVCGAPNALVGLKAPLAKPGAQLPGGAKSAAIASTHILLFRTYSTGLSFSLFYLYLAKSIPLILSQKNLDRFSKSIFRKPN